LDIPKNLDTTLTMADVSKPFSPSTGEPPAVITETNGNGNGTRSLTDDHLQGEELFEEVGKFIVDRLPDPVEGADQKDVFNEIENGVVMAALKRTRGNKQAAANLLGLYRPRLYGMIKRHNLDGKV
jgi:transcriptional regulator of acetoin/glycerol metabolism